MFCWKNVSIFTAKTTHIFFSKKFQYICVSLNVNFNDTLTKDIVSFKQLGPGYFHICCIYSMYSDRQASASSVDPDETPQDAFAILFAIHPAILATTSGSKLYLFKF